MKQSKYYHKAITLLLLMAPAQGVIGHICSEECHTCALPVCYRSRQWPSSLSNKIMGTFPLSILQARLIFSEITLPTRIESMNLGIWQNSRSLCFHIMQVIWLIPASCSENCIIGDKFFQTTTQVSAKSQTMLLKEFRWLSSPTPRLQVS